MEDSGNLAYPREEQKNPFIIFFTNLLSSIKLPFPFPPKNNGAKSKPVAADSQASDSLISSSPAAEPLISSPPAAEPLRLGPPAAVDDESKPGFVTLPRQEIESIKLEVEAAEAGQTTNPLILWQVYALGGIIVLRWAWMRWNERKGQKKKPDNDPSAAHD